MLLVDRVAFIGLSLVCVTIDQSCNNWSVTFTKTLSSTTVLQTELYKAVWLLPIDNWQHSAIYRNRSAIATSRRCKSFCATVGRLGTAARLVYGVMKDCDWLTAEIIVHNILNTIARLIAVQLALHLQQRYRRTYWLILQCIKCDW